VFATARKSKTYEHNSHSRVFFSKLENRRKIISKEREQTERRIKAEKHVKRERETQRDRVNMTRDLLCVRKALSKDLKQKAAMLTNVY
jgi:hypothetical protein